MLICQLTDLHLRPEGVAAYRVVETNTLTERAFRAVAALDPRPDAVLITGDLTDCGLDSEYALLARLIREHLRMPVYVIPGNHDRRSTLRAELGSLPGVNSDPEFIQYTVEDFPVRLVMLDTLVPGAPHGELCTERLAFLDRELAGQPDKPTLIGMHHPPFVSGIDHMDRISLRNPGTFAEIIARHPQVELIVCGHHHRPVIARVANAIASIGPSVAHQVELELRPEAAGAFVLEPPAFQLHRWTKATGIVSHLAYVDDFPGPYPFYNDSDEPPCP
jgi:3',5'-cyclic-AMP phosphodiesterase